MATTYVSAFRDGTISIGAKCKGALVLAKTARSDKKLRAIVSSIARHGYEAGVLLVPGVPEADTDNDALDAVMRFKKVIAWRTAGNVGWPALT